MNAPTYPAKRDITPLAVVAPIIFDNQSRFPVESCGSGKIDAMRRPIGDGLCRVEGITDTHLM